MAKFDDILKQLQENPEQMDFLKQKNSSSIDDITLPKNDTNLKDLLKNKNQLSSVDSFINKFRQNKSDIDDSVSAPTNTIPPYQSSDRLGDKSVFNPPIQGPNPTTIPQESSKEEISPLLASNQNIPEMIKTNPEVVKSLLESGFTNNTVQKLKEVQDKANSESNTADMMKAVGMISSGALGLGLKTKAPDLKNLNDFMDESKKDSMNKIKQFQDQTEKEKFDPQSQYSATYRNLARPILKQLGMDDKLIESSSGAQLKEILPSLEKQVIANQRTEYLKQKGAETSNSKSEALELVKQSKLDNRFDKLGKLITPEMASGRSQFGRDAASLSAVQNARQLFDGYKSLNDIPPAQVYEIARMMDKVVSGGNPTIGATYHLDTPETAVAYLNKVKQQFNNKAQGKQAGDFLSQYVHTLDREENAAQKRQTGAIIKSLGSYANLAKEYPERWDEFTTLQGIPYANSEEIKKFLDSKKSPDEYFGDVLNKKTHTNIDKKSRILGTETTIGDFPKKVRHSDGRTATVSNESELKEAKAEGFN